jgi:hypothetical protein
MNWHEDAYIEAHTALLNAIDAAGATCYVEICNSANLVLATLPLSFPAGEVNPTTGALVFDFGDPDAAAANGGEAHHGRLKDKNGKIWLDNLLCTAAGFPAPMTGMLVLNSLTVVEDAPFEGVSLAMAGA